MSDALATTTVAFDQDISRVLGAVRTALARVLERLPSGATGPAEISSVLGIHRKLAWHVSKVVYHPELSVAGQHLPGKRAMHTFLDAAARNSVPRDLIDAALTAVTQFERLSKRHAGDRASLHLLIANSGGRTDGEAAISHRKTAFQSGSAIWGVQASAQFCTNIIHRGSHRELFDMACVRGLVNFRRVRPNLPWVITRVNFLDDDGRVDRIQREPLDPPGAPMIRPFCSQPLPELRSVGCGPGSVEYELVEGPVGSTGEVTVVTGDVIRGAGPLRRNELNSQGVYATHMRTPCRVVVSDLIVHEEIFGSLDPEVFLYSELRGPDVWLERDTPANVIPSWERVEHLGRGAGVVHTPAIPRYAELIQHTFDKLGWDGDRCDVYRVRMEYPPIPTAMVVRHPLPG